MLVSVDSGYAYQWFYNDNNIQGANKQFLYQANMQNGDYKVRIEFHQGCSKLSETFIIENSQKSLSLAETITIYPNPTTGKITIEIDNDYICEIKYKVSDNLGRNRKEAIINKTQKLIQFANDLSNLNAGTYLIEFVFDGNEKTSKLRYKIA